MKYLKRILLLLWGTGMLYSFGLLMMIFSSVHDTPNNSSNTIIILGARVIGKTPTDAHPSKILKERLDTAIPYLEKNPELPVIVCGGQGTDEAVSEAQVMKTYLVSHGTAAKRITVETQSKRTKENIDNAQKILPAHKAVIVTSDFHMYRAKMLARRAGIGEVSGLVAETHASSKFLMYFREVIALGYGLLFDW